MTRQPALIYEFGDFRLDTARRQLRGRGGVTVPLTAKAFETLLYLVGRGGTVLDKIVKVLKLAFPSGSPSLTFVGSSIAAFIYKRKDGAREPPPDSDNSCGQVFLRHVPIPCEVLYSAPCTASRRHLQSGCT